MDTINETGEVDDEEVQDVDQIELFIEMKYCSICHLE